MNSKRSKIIILVIIFLIVILICAMYIVDRNRMKNNKPVVFSTWGSQYVPQADIEKVVKYKPLEELKEEDINIANPDFYIVMLDNIVYHKNKLDKFIENVNSNTPDVLKILQFKMEPKAEFMIKEIEFTKEKFIIKADNRWDGDLEQENRKIVINEYSTKNYKLVKEHVTSKDNNVKTHYYIKLASNNNSSSVYVCDYLDIKVNTEENFKLEFNKDLTKEKELILSKSETSKYDYDIYSYKGTVNVIVGNQKMTLRDALLTGKITIEQILEKANRDSEEYKTIMANRYADGGSVHYIYEDYTIIKLNVMTLEPSSNNKDLYIGGPEMRIDDVKIQ